MVKADVWHEIHSRCKLKETKKSIARCVGLSVQTVRKILRQAEPQPYKRLRTATTLLVPFEGYIRQRVAAVGYCARSVFEEIQGQGYPGSYDAVKRFVRPLRKGAVREATVRFETPPGRQAQADWGHCWTVVGGKRVKIHLFVMTLGYSRRMFAVGARDEKLATFIRCHEEAFDHLGGVAHEILYDNPKTVVLSRDFEGRHIQWNATFWDFSRYYGFRPWAHRPYRAQVDPGRIAAGIVTGIGFLGAGAIIRIEDLVRGLTTAGCIWFVAALGIAIGQGLFVLAAVSSACALAVLLGLTRVEQKIRPTVYRSILVISPLIQAESVERSCRELLTARNIHVRDIGSRVSRDEGRAEVTFKIRVENYLQGAEVIRTMPALEGVTEARWF